MRQTLGRPDGAATREESVAHAAAIVAATGVPVTADLENAFAHDAADVAQTIDLALEAGLAGCSVEDYDGAEIYDIGLAAERIAAAAAPAGPVHLVRTARREPPARPPGPRGHHQAPAGLRTPGPTCSMRRA